ncbi:hypothetical protein [Mycobacterium tuberculosis]|uniref:hypothetical protein n=1 Tax=Mycobacterium tuberculosis TaxID=1773 RepID=UPI002711EDB7|nr:hypothetical protein [Mycobacterium tuberculosis]
MTVVVVEWSAAEQAVLDRGVPVPAEPSISLRGDDGTAPGVDSGWPELSDPAAMMNSSAGGAGGLLFGNGGAGGPGASGGALG